MTANPPREPEGGVCLAGLPADRRRTAAVRPAKEGDPIKGVYCRRMRAPQDNRIADDGCDICGGLAGKSFMKHLRASNSGIQSQKTLWGVREFAFSNERCLSLRVQAGTLREQRARRGGTGPGAATGETAAPADARTNT